MSVDLNFGRYKENTAHNHVEMPILNTENFIKTVAKGDR